MKRNAKGRRRVKARAVRRSTTKREAKTVMNMQIATKQVDDPYGAAGHKLLVDVHRNEDVIEGLLSRGQITPGRYQIAIRFRALYERAAIGSVPAIDYSKPFVSGGVPGDIFTDELIGAGQEMIAIGAKIGQSSVSFLSQLVGAGVSFAVVAQRYAEAYGMPTREARAFVRGRLCEALDLLGAHWGMAEGRRSNRRPRLVAGGQTPVATEELHRDDFIVINDMRED